MRVLDRYIVQTLLGAVAMVLSVLLVLAGLFMFIAQQGDIGTGSYTALDALWYVLLNLPSQLFDFLPVAALIGSLMGLGALARGSELTVMRAAGVSFVRLAASVGIAGVLLAAVGVLTGEYLAPSLGAMASEHKAYSKFANVSFAGQGGAWIRDGDLIIKAEQQSSEGRYGGLMVFDLSKDHELLGVGRAASAAALPEGGWQLSEYAESRFASGRVTARTDALRKLNSGVSAGFLSIAASDPTQLSVRTLVSVMQYLRSNAQDVRDYRFAMWSRIARTVAVIFAVLLAVPFAFGSLRSSGAGARTTLGLAMGTALYLLQRMVESGTIVLDLNPVLLAWLPTLLLASVTLGLIARLR